MGKRTSTMPFGVQKGKHGQRKSPSLMAVKRKSGKNMMRNVVLQGLRHLRAPSVPMLNKEYLFVVALLATLVFTCGGLDWSPIDHFETFAGDQSITKGEIAAGRTAVPFELNLDPASQDILTDQGFANAIYQTLFGKAVAKVRTRNQKRIRNAACRFLRASFKTEHVLDRSKATHAHWMKHANLASALHFLASKQLGAD
ncbi:unnamed protein product [Durusdinium trenchii]|uniref:Uncharacterized protein n=1 Tax=Durusdinium trenchii TaxID=1381693 RepID=A0ABP0RFH7_9DINO